MWKNLSKSSNSFYLIVSHPFHTFYKQYCTCDIFNRSGLQTVVCITVSVVLTWLLGSLSLNIDRDVYHTLFLIFNAMQVRELFLHTKFNTCQFLMNVSRMFHSNILNKVVHTGLLRPHTESHYWCKFSISYCCILLFWNDNQNMTQLVESLLKRRAS